MRIVFVGPPGCGKGTQAERLKNYLGVVHLSTGEMLRDAASAGTKLGRQAAQYMEAGKLVPDDVVVGIVEQRLADPDCAAGYLLDGFPRTLAQAEALDRLLCERGTPLHLAIEFQVDEEHLFARLANRGRTDDREETIRERLRQYERLTTPLVAHYRKHGILRTVDGNGSPSEVYARIRQVVDATSLESV